MWTTVVVTVTTTHSREERRQKQPQILTYITEWSVNTGCTVHYITSQLFLLFVLENIVTIRPVTVICNKTSCKFLYPSLFWQNFGENIRD